MGIIAIGGAVYLAKTEKFNTLANTGKAFADKMFGGSAGALTSINKAHLGKSFLKINSSMVARMNSGLEPGRDINCFHTSCGYILESLFGIKCHAFPYSGIDEASGMIIPGRTKQLFHSIFSGINEIQLNSNRSFSEDAKRIPNNSTGVLQVGFGMMGHFLNYEKDKRGRVTIIDCQSGDIIKNISRLDGIYDIWSILDFSNASLKPESDEILGNIIERRN